MTLLFNTIQAAERLGVSYDWLQRAAASRKVPCVRMGRLVRFSEANIHAIIDMHTQQPMVAQAPHGSARTTL